MNKTYSFTKGLSKSLVQVGIFGLSIGAVIVAAQYPVIYNSPIADLVATGVRKVIGGLTVGGLVTFVINYLKNR